MLTNIEDQISRAETSFSRVETIERNMLKAQEIGQEFDMNNYRKQMEDAERELNRNVSDAIQTAIDKLDMAVEDVDTEDEFEQLRIKILDELDQKTFEM